jgi:hypothetical protein
LLPVAFALASAECGFVAKLLAHLTIQRLHDAEHLAELRFTRPNPAQFLAQSTRGQRIAHPELLESQFAQNVPQRRVPFLTLLRCFDRFAG